MNATDGRLLHNLQFASSPQGHALVDVGIKPEELYSYDTGKPHGVIIDEKAGSGHWETKEVTIPAEPGVFVPAIPYDEQYQAQMLKLWDKFYKVDKAHTREYGGNGIGLSIVKAIMESFHQGYGVRNFDNGVEFWFELDAKS